MYRKVVSIVKAISEEHLFFKGTLTFNEFKSYNLFHSRKAIVAMFLLSFLFSFISWWSLFGELLIMSSLLISITGGTIGALLFTLLTMMVARKNFTSESMLKLEQRFTVNMIGINLQTDKSNATFEWNDILSANEIEKLFILYVAKNKAILIPKRYFSSEEEIESFRLTIKSRVNVKNLNLLENPIESSSKYKWLAVVNHVCALFPIPIVNILLTLVYWIMIRNKSSFVNFHGKQSINFQVSFSLYFLFLFLIWFGVDRLIEYFVEPPMLTFINVLIIIFGIASVVIFAVFYIAVVITAIVSSLFGKRFNYPLSIKWFRTER